VKVNHGSNPGVQYFLHCLIRILDSESGFKRHGRSQPAVKLFALWVRPAALAA
jgi:hypothetical protein